MEKQTIIGISVYPYVRKYLHFHYQEQTFNGNDRRSILYHLIRSLLEPMPKIDPKDFVRPVKIDFGALFTLRMSYSSVRRHGNYVSGASVKRFNEAITDIIYDEMYRLVTKQVQQGLQADDAIRDFQRFYEFSEDELAFESLKKWYYRERCRANMRVVHNATIDLENETVLTYYYERNPQLPEYTPAA